MLVRTNIFVYLQNIFAVLTIYFLLFASICCRLVLQSANEHRDIIRMCLWLSRFIYLF